MLHNCFRSVFQICLFMIWCLLGIIKDQSSIALHLPHFIILCSRYTDCLQSFLTIFWTIIHFDKLTPLLWMITFDKDYQLLTIIWHQLLIILYTGNFDAATNRMSPASRLWKHFPHCSLSDLTPVDLNHFTLAIHILVTSWDILCPTIRIVLCYISVVILGWATGLIAYFASFLIIPKIVQVFSIHKQTVNKLNTYYHKQVVT